MDDGRNNDGWELCAVEGCGHQPRLSGLCPFHDCQALRAMLDGVPFRPTAVPYPVEKRDLPN